MRSLFHHESLDTRRAGYMAWISIAVHAVVLVLVAGFTLHAHRVVIFRPMTQGSVQSVSVAAISRGAWAAASAQKTSVEKRPLPHPRLAPKKREIPRPKQDDAQQSPAASPAMGQQTASGKNSSSAAGSGSDAQNMYPAYPVVSPSPPVKDRALLPATDQKVIVDVNLGANGQVQQATLVSGLGNPLDQLVLDTVRGWQFHPAMLNGNPVPSTMELVFPFNRNYPIAE